MKLTHTHSPSTSEPIPFTGRPINGSLLLKISEAAAALPISRSSLYRLFESGELAWAQIGAARRVTSAEILRPDADPVVSASVSTSHTSAVCLAFNGKRYHFL